MMTHERWTITPLSLGMLLLVMSLGCGDPISTPLPFDPDPAGFELVVGPDESRYQWHLSASGYAVQKPPQMSFVSSLTERLSRGFDPVTAEVVPWSSEGMDHDLDVFLRQAFQPRPSELDRRLSIKTDELAGPQAFDVSVDGSRLVTTDGEKLTLYKTESGVRIGSFTLPAEIRKAGLIEAVRFGGSSNDFLVASPGGVFRISSKDGSVTAQGPPCGDPIKKWIINNKATAMIVLTESGDLLGGDPNLEVFSRYDLGRLTVDDASLSPDGTRITVVAKGKPRVYLQENFQVMGQTDLEGLDGASSLSTASGPYSEAWIDGDRILFSYKDSEGVRQSSEFRMFWRPQQILACSEEDNWNWLLIVGHQFIDNRERVVLFDFAPDMRYNSIALPLDEVPQRMASDRVGQNVALLDSQGLHLVRRESWIVPEPWLLNQWVAALVAQGKGTDIERAVEIIRKQKRLGYGLTPETFAARFIDYTAYIWNRYQRADPEGEIAKKMEQWHSDGSDVAQLAGALRHYHETFFAWKRYFHVHPGRSYDFSSEQELIKANEELAKALEKEDPPLVAYTTKIRIEAALNELEAIDDLCIACAKRYPGEHELFLSISGFLTPDWYGEPGDYLSFALPYSRMFESPESELAYMMAAASTLVTFHHQDEISWKTYDAGRVAKGLHEYMRRGMPADDLFLSLIFILRHRENNRVEVDKALRYLISTVASMPRFQRIDFEITGMQLADKLEYDLPINWEAIDKIRQQK